MGGVGRAGGWWGDGVEGEDRVPFGWRWGHGIARGGAGGLEGRGRGVGVAAG